MGARAKSREHQLSSVVEVRSARSGDEPALTDLGLARKDGEAVLVGEQDGAIVAALSCAPRPFETEFLGRKTFHIDVIASSDSAAHAPFLSGTIERLFEEGCELLTSRRPEGEPTIDALQAAGFREIERLVTLSRPLSKNSEPLPSGVEVAIPADAEGCAEVAAAAFTFDRFHADPAVNDAAASALKAQWARNAVGGRADRVFVTREGGTITGFNACLLRDDTAIIDLIGVAPSYQGRGLGRKLTAAAVAHYSGKATRITVGTQEHNAASLSLYRAAGFHPLSTAITLHLHA